MASAIIDKIHALKQSQGNFDVCMTLSTQSDKELHWWLSTLRHAYHFVHTPPIDIVVHSDTSLSGWGGVLRNQRTGGVLE